MIRPVSWTDFMSYWVSVSPLGPLYRGVDSTMGWGEITTPAAWVEAWRGSPSRTSAMVNNSRTSRVVFFEFPEAGLLFQGLASG